MTVERIQVEGGFLDGLDLALVGGLDVVIGPRGSGKTSIVELIRFCLDLPAFTERARNDGRQHALSILGSGRVSVTIRINGDAISFTRTAEDAAPRRSSEIPLSPLIILAQNEIETIGLDAQSRVRLIDAFSRTPTGVAQEGALLAYIRSLTTQIRSVAAEIASLEQQVAVKAALENELAVAREDAASLQADTVVTSEHQQLETLNLRIAQRSAQSEVIKRSIETIERWQSQLSPTTAARPTLQPWPDTTSAPAEFGNAQLMLAKAIERVDEAVQRASSAARKLRDLQSRAENEFATLAKQAQELRTRLEAVHEGAGAVARRITEAEQRLSKLQATQQLLETRKEDLRAVRTRREEYLDSLDEIRRVRFDERTRIASELNADLGPRIEVRVERFGLFTEYASAISAALRGSGLHYGTLSPLLARALSPREFVDLVEIGVAQALAQAANIDADRAQRLIEHLRMAGTEDILTAPIDDAVELLLLDGASYKSTEHLSTGQRCTVILPILLRHRESTLIVDQPEDHLDNAFIVDTVIHAIKSRSNSGQLLFSTHNANIPVLAEANLVVFLGSDGTRGFVRHALPLEAPESVNAITTVMEGGIEAFQQRASFYGAERRRA